MTGKLYGAKCFRCAHLDHRGEQEADPIDWVGPLTCPTCRFCQNDALHRMLMEYGTGIWDPEVRRAVDAFKRGESHPILERLRAECLAIEAESEPGGKPETKEKR